MTRELKLKSLIIENFIPIEEKVKLEKRIAYNDETDEYEIQALSNSGRCVQKLFVILC